MVVIWREVRKNAGSLPLFQTSIQVSNLPQIETIELRHSALLFSERQANLEEMKLTNMAENASTVDYEYCEQHTTENDNAENIDLDPEEDIQNYFQNIEGRFESSSDEGSEPEAKGQPNCQ